jgi:UDP-glucose 4-epimerase
MIEEILKDLYVSDPSWKISLLRYFNPIGAHASGKIGEDPAGIPNNLFPFITQVAIGRRDSLSVFGNDYSTTDGTGVRDYIHVVDLARGHVQALQYLNTLPQGKVSIHNLGTGLGTSVLELVNAFKKVNQIEIPYNITERRAGDIATCFADASLALKELNWKAEFGIEQMCLDGWNWQKNNPNGYQKK